MLHLISPCCHTLLAPVFISEYTGTECPQKRGDRIRTNLGGKRFFMDYSHDLLMTFNTIMNITIEMNLQNIQVMLEGRSSFLQGGLENNPSNDSVKVPSQVLEVNITLFFCDYCRHITPLYI